VKSTENRGFVIITVKILIFSVNSVHSSSKLFFCAESHLCSDVYKFWFISDRTSLY